MKQSQKIKLTLNKGKVIHGFLPLFWWSLSHGTLKELLTILDQKHPPQALEEDYGDGNGKNESRQYIEGLMDLQ